MKFLQYIRKTLRYNKRTGIFIRLKSRRSDLIGKPAGYIGARGYICIGIKGHYYKAHRLAWLYVTGKWPLHEIDHRNRNVSDNRWSNLRQATHARNIANSKNRIDSIAGWKGVNKMPDCNRWCARISFNNKSYHLGLFSTAQQAHAAYVKAAKKYFGEFARAR